MITTEELSLPVPTNATVRGPILAHEGQGLTVSYDCEGINGTVVWTRLVFDDVLALDYRAASSCEADQVTGSGYVARYTDSDWLRHIRSLWNDTVGWQEYQRKQGGDERFSHFRAYFDDAACIEIVAASLRVETGDPAQGG